MNIEKIISDVLHPMTPDPGTNGYTFRMTGETGAGATFHIQYNIDEQIIVIFGQLDEGPNLGLVSRDALLGLLREAVEPMRSGLGVGLMPDSDDLAVYCIISAPLFNEQRLESTLPLVFEQLLIYEKFYSANEAC